MIRLPYFSKPLNHLNRKDRGWMFDVITVGSATLDAFADTGKGMFRPCPECPSHVKVPFGSKILLSGLQFCTGGGGTNTAVGFSRLGFQTGWIGKLGNDATAQSVLKELKQEGVDTSLCAIDRGKASGYSIILDAKGHDRTVLAFKGSNDDLKPSDLDFSKIQSQWLYCSSQLGRSARTLLRIVTHAQRQKSRIAFNPSTYMITSERSTVTQLLHHTHVLIFNAEEAQLLVGRASIEKTMKRIHQRGPSMVVITNGKHGAHASDGKQLWHCKALSVPVKESTGAGDAFATGFIAGLIKGKPITDAMKMGMTESASVIQHIGAKNILMTDSQIQRYLPKIPQNALTKVH